MLAALTVFIGILSRRELRQHHKNPDWPDWKDTTYNRDPAGSTVRRGNVGRGEGKPGLRRWVAPEVVSLRAFSQINCDSNQNKENLVIWVVLVLLLLAPI